MKDMSPTGAEAKPASANSGVTTAAHERLRGMVLSGFLPGGSVVQERELSDLLGVSRTPVREALQRLEGEGFLERRGRFLCVQSVSVTEVLEMLAVRQLLECEATRAACGRISADAIHAIRARMEGMADAAEVSDDAHWAADDLLHLTIARESGNALLLRLVGELRQKTRLFGLRRIPSRFGPGKEEHLAILDALAAGDSGRAVDLMRTHIGNARQGILTAIAGGSA